VRLIRTLLYNTKPLDPGVFLSVIGTLLAVAMLARLIEARRAARLDPTQALRAEYRRKTPAMLPVDLPSSVT
jgi:hypothetical protein